MKKEIIIRLSLKTDKCQKKAMKVAANVTGVESVTVAGGDRNLLLVIGEGVDTNKLTKKLKKKVGSVEIVELRTRDSFEAALPLGAAAVMGSKESMAYAAARSSPYHQWQYATPPSPYAYPYYHHHPSPMAVHGGGGGGGYGVGSSYSLAVARSHPANYSPLVEKHDYYPMDHSSSSSRSSFKAVSRSRRESDTNSCSIL